MEDRIELPDIKAGRISNGTEIMDWLDTWGTDAEKPFS